MDCPDQILDQSLVQQSSSCIYAQLSVCIQQNARLHAQAVDYQHCMQSLDFPAHMYVIIGLHSSKLIVQRCELIASPSRVE